MTRNFIGGLGINGCLGRYRYSYPAVLTHLSTAILDGNGRELILSDPAYSERATPCLVDVFEDGIQIVIEHTRAFRSARQYSSNATRWKDLGLFMRSGRLSATRSTSQTSLDIPDHAKDYDAILVLMRHAVPAERDASIPGFSIEIPLVEKLRDFERPLPGKSDSRDLCDRVMAQGGRPFHLLDALQRGGATGRS